MSYAHHLTRGLDPLVRLFVLHHCSCDAALAELLARYFTS
jgi:hypothetical protein